MKEQGLFFNIYKVQGNLVVEVSQNNLPNVPILFSESYSSYQGLEEKEVAEENLTLVKAMDSSSLQFCLPYT